MHLSSAPFSSAMFDFIVFTHHLYDKNKWKKDKSNTYNGYKGNISFFF